MEAKFANIPDRLWKEVETILPPPKPRPFGGRPPNDNRQVLAGIVYRLRTGCQWKAIPPQFGSGSTCHERFQQWTRAGVFREIFTRLVRYYDKKRGVKLKWTSLDSASVKAPKGGT